MPDFLNSILTNKFVRKINKHYSCRHHSKFNKLMWKICVLVLSVILLSCSNDDSEKDEGNFDPDNTKFVGTWREISNGQFFSETNIVYETTECDKQRTITFKLNGTYKWECYEGTDLNNCNYCGTYTGTYIKTFQNTDYVKYELKFYQPDGTFSHVKEPLIKIGNGILGMDYLTENPSDSGPRSTFTQYQKE